MSSSGLLTKFWVRHIIKSLTAGFLEDIIVLLKYGAEHLFWVSYDVLLKYSNIL
jgi:hypothetical protein